MGDRGLPLFFYLYCRSLCSSPSLPLRPFRYATRTERKRGICCTSILKVVIMAIEESPATKKKIFISHSSKDKVIVSNFVDHILMLGIGLNAEDIFCTSIEEMAIRNGEDIRKHIQGNIRTADFSLLLIFNNYKESEICINEMGAVWAYDTNVRLFMLPNTTFDKIGWLYETRKADKIYDAMALDSFYTELCEYYSSSVNYPSWSRQRQTFLDLLAQKVN